MAALSQTQTQDPFDSPDKFDLLKKISRSSHAKFIPIGDDPKMVISVSLMPRLFPPKHLLLLGDLIAQFDEGEPRSTKEAYDDAASSH